MHQTAQFPQRHLHWQGCFNIRDLGMLPLMDGGTTNWKAFIRADNPGNLTEEGQKNLLDYGVRTIIDLRMPQEAEKSPSHVGRLQYLDYHLCPLERFTPEVSALISKVQNRAEVYCIMLDHYADLFVAVLRVMARAKPGVVLFHCQAGKDRTGIVTALLLSLAGVPDASIAADYAESQICLRPVYLKELALAGSDEKLGFWSKQTVTEDMMLIVLNHIREQYGDTEKYLLRAGLFSEEIKSLRSRLGVLTFFFIC